MNIISSQINQVGIRSECTSSILYFYFIHMRCTDHKCLSVHMKDTTYSNLQSDHCVLVSLYLDLIIQLAQVPNDPRIQLIIPIFMRICIIIFFRPSPITQVQTDLDQKLDALLKYLTNRACQQHSHNAILTGIPRIIIDWVWLGIPNCNWVAGCYLYITYFRKALRN